MKHTQVEKKQHNGRPILGRVLVRMFQHNPTRFLVRDPKKFAQWIILSQTEFGKWENGHGIRIERWTE